MKTRLGFISNSSSSSFIVLGFDVTHLDQEWDYEEIKERNYQLYRGNEDGMKDGQKVIGITLSSGNSCEEIESGDIDIRELERLAAQVREEFNFSDLPWKLYWGTRMC